MSITEKKRFQQIRRNWNSKLRALRIDGKNQKLYGEQAPKFAELLWIPTASLIHSVKAGSSKDSARVIQQWPSQQVVLTRDLPTIRACLAHWKDGLSWEETGIYQQMLDRIGEKGKVDRLRNIRDIKKRYENVDLLHEKVALKGGLNPRSQLIPGNFKEEGGILVHLGPEGEPFFGMKGHHRLAIALSLELDYVPAQLGVVHVSAINHIGPFRR